MIMDYNEPKAANLSNYIIPEFYVYHLDPDGTETYTWYDAVDCIDYFTQIYGSLGNIPETLMKELIGVHNTNWLCPNIPPGDTYVLQNDPWNYNFGTNFNFVVNYCFVSAQRQGITDPNCVPYSGGGLLGYVDFTRVSHKFVR